MEREGLMASLDLNQRKQDIQNACHNLNVALEKGSMGEMVERNHDLIMEYYSDVLANAEKSFQIARWSAIGGFGIFVITLICVIVAEIVHGWDVPRRSLLTVSGLGAVAGMIVQIFAGVAFYLYQKASDQFGAFHTCLERTHRYLVAYKIAEELQTNKDQTLHDLVCIMANAPMIMPPQAAATPPKEQRA
jgi:hypothetical protein